MTYQIYFTVLFSRRELNSAYPAPSLLLKSRWSQYPLFCYSNYANAALKCIIPSREIYPRVSHARFFRNGNLNLDIKLWTSEVNENFLSRRHFYALWSIKRPSLATRKAEHPHKLCIRKGETLCCANFGLLRPRRRDRICKIQLILMNKTDLGMTLYNSMKRSRNTRIQNVRWYVASIILR